MSERAEDGIPPGINALPDPQAFVAPSPVVTSKRKRRAGDEPGGLNINSLMDIMTIILVFLIKSFTTNPVTLRQAKDLQMPFSTANEEPPITTAILVTLNTIAVDDTPCQAVESGKISENDLAQSGMLISRCLEELQKTVDHQKRIAQLRPDRPAFNDTVVIMVDRFVPFKLITQVMYTAGQAEFSKFKFSVVKAPRGSS